jgi:hypothetical protein
VKRVRKVVLTSSSVTKEIQKQSFPWKKDVMVSEENSETVFDDREG